MNMHLNSFKTRCYKYFFDDNNATISIFSTFFSLWIVHNLLKLFDVFCNLYHPWTDATIRCNLNQEQARRFEEL